MDNENKTSAAQIKAVAKYSKAHYSRLCLDIDKELLEQAKAKSIETGISIRSIVVNALKEFINS